MSRDQQGMTVESAREVLKGAGLRSTTSRVAILQHLAGARKPLSHAEVSNVLVPAGYDKSTLYRCLVELADAGLLSRLDAGDHSWRFELRRGDDHEGDHPHFVCTDCGRVSCLPDVEVKITSPRPSSKRPKLGEVSEIFLKGKCPECAE